MKRWRNLQRDAHYRRKLREDKPKDPRPDTRAPAHIEIREALASMYEDFINNANDITAQQTRRS